MAFENNDLARPLGRKRYRPMEIAGVFAFIACLSAIATAFGKPWWSAVLAASLSATNAHIKPAVEDRQVPAHPDTSHASRE
ncbi:MAG TPA: hypothetical protein VJ577_15320 [Burkholderiaceae bacterium]|nr:hypothetical protein [Burkholderiaceae bacterium]